MFKTLYTRGLAAGTLFKMLFIGNLLSWGIVFIIFSVAAFFGATTVTLNGASVVGFYGLIAGLVMGAVFIGVWTCISWLFLSFGVFLWTRFKPIIFRIKMDKKSDANSEASQSE